MTAVLYLNLVFWTFQKMTSSRSLWRSVCLSINPVTSWMLYCGFLWDHIWGPLWAAHSLIPRLSPRTITKSKEGESVVPFQMWFHRTNVVDISMGKFRCHSRADCPFSYSVFLRVISLGLLKQKERPGLCSRWHSTVCGHKFSSPEGLEWVSCILYLYWTVPVSLAACITR